MAERMKSLVIHALWSIAWVNESRCGNMYLEVLLHCQTFLVVLNCLSYLFYLCSELILIDVGRPCHPV
jgi:hypothetical protein